MSSLKAIREKFGVSQQDAAHWLGISRSLVALYERGIRSLPTHALLQLAKLEMIAMEFDKNDSRETNGNDGMVSKRINKRESGSWETIHGSGQKSVEKTKLANTADTTQPAKGMAYLNAIEAQETIDNIRDDIHPSMILKLEKAHTLKRQLNMVKSRHQVLLLQMQLAKALLDKCDEATSEKEKLWLQMIYHNIASKLSKVDESKQLPLQAKIVSIQLQHAMMRK